MTAVAIKYFYDKECKQPYPTNKNGEAVTDWGITIPGQKKKIELFAQNQSRDRAILRQPYSHDEDQKIIDYPANLMGGESGKVTLEFAPNKDRIDGLHAGWGFDVVIG